MKLIKTEEFISKGIKMYKLISSAQNGIFSYKPATYDYKTVYNLEEAVELNQNGWYFEEYDSFFADMLINIYRDLINKIK